MTYTLKQIRDRIARELSRNADYDVIDSAIRSAIAFHEGKPYWFLLDQTTITLGAGSNSAGLPSDFARAALNGFELFNGTVWLNRRSGFSQVTFDALSDLRAYVQTGIPRNYALFGERLYVDMNAIQAYPIRVTYYRRDANPPMGEDDTSLWFDEGYDLIHATATALYKDMTEYDDTTQDWAKVELWENRLTARNNTYDGIY